MTMYNNDCVNGSGIMRNAKKKETFKKQLEKELLPLPSVLFDR